MTQLREHVFNLLSDPTIETAVPGGIHERGSFETTPELRPFMIYVFGGQRVEPKWTGPRRLDLIVYLHDDVGDYLKIDATHDLVESIITTALPANDGSGFMECSMIERSQDFQDDALNTFYKFARYQVVSSK